MDLKNLETTSTYAIKAVYEKYWSLVPEEYRLEPVYGKSIDPFYDPELTFENRTQYKLTKLDYPSRSTPWIIITWNTENGVAKSDLTQRRVGTGYYTDPDTGAKTSYKTMNAQMVLNMAIYSNSLTALLAFQEHYALRVRPKDYAIGKGHSVLGDFSVAIDTTEMTLHKLPREKSTLCYLYFNVTIDYPILGFGSDAYIIKTITSDIYKKDTNPDLLLTRDEIVEETN